MKKLLASALFLTALALPAKAATITITGTACDASGCGPFSATAQTDQVTVTSAVVTPQTAAAGTMRTLTVQATSSAGLPITSCTATAAGITFTPLTGQPAGTCAWTFVY